MRENQGEEPSDSSEEDWMVYLKAERQAEADEVTLRALDALDETKKLIEIWKVLNTLTVSLDRLGMYWHFHGEEAAKEALHQFMDPQITEKIANARYLITAILEARDPAIGERLEKMAENESEMGYWDGPK